MAKFPQSPREAGYVETLAPAFLAPGTRVFRRGKLSVIVATENGRRHLSIAHQTRYPTWDEIAEARYALLPHDITVAMLLPPPAEYVNFHENCFHLHELREVPV